MSDVVVNNGKRTETNYYYSDLSGNYFGGAVARTTATVRNGSLATSTVVPSENLI